MSDKYILVDKKPVRCPDISEWGKWFEVNDKSVGKTTIGDINISTVFLGLDHNHWGGEPVLFETMIFGGEDDQYQDRCSTYEEAEAMHERVVKMVKDKHVTH